MKLVFHDASFQGDVNDIHEKIQYLVDHFCAGNKALFGRDAGIPAPVIASLTGGRKSKPSFEVLQKILAQFPVNANWLVMGQGQMLREEAMSATISLDNQPHSLTTEQWELLQRALVEMTPAKTAAQVETEWLGRTYHFGEQPTPGLDYDDRITTRLNLNEQELQEWMDSPDFNELPYKKLGKRIVVTERGLRQFLGDLPKLS